MIAIAIAVAIHKGRLPLCIKPQHGCPLQQCCGLGQPLIGVDEEHGRVGDVQLQEGGDAHSCAGRHLAFQHLCGRRVQAKHPCILQRQISVLIQGHARH